MEAVVPPGFRFHPTEEELVGYYLLRRIKSMKIDVDVIVDIDLYKMEPWDIQARCNLGYEDQNEWYFFSHKDRKYPTGTRTNRATAAGFWKATGRDKAVMSKNNIIGMRKTLVFYKGRAPNGRKTDWIMHEYRHQTTEYAPPQEEGWVVCRAFKKPIPSQRPAYEAWNTCSQRPPYNTTADSAPNEYYALHASNFDSNELVERLPRLESPTLFTGKEVVHEETSNEFTDWKNLDSLLAFQGNDTTFFPFQCSPYNGDLEAEYGVGHN